MKIKPCSTWAKYYWYRRYRRVFHPHPPCMRTVRNTLFQPDGFRRGVCRPKVTGGYCVMYNDIVVTPLLDEVAIRRVVPL